MNTIQQLNQAGQSAWYDNVTRANMVSGEMQRLIDLGITGVTSNPTIFEKAITGSDAYDEQFRALADLGTDPDAILEELVVDDIRAVADLLRPVYDSTYGRDGFVSIEESPELAYDSERSALEARRLFDLVDRPNVMIKIPSTPEGIAAVEEAIFDGVNVNITLMFSLDAYEATGMAYIHGLERRLDAGLPVDGIASVASFFVSRVDTLVDRLLEAKAEAAGSSAEGERLRALMGKAAVANAKLAYQRFLAIFHGAPFERSRRGGAAVQRVLWGSTSTKNPAYRDVVYVEELIGPETINTLPPQTVEAVLDHGVVRPTLTEGVEEAEQIMRDLADAGIDMDAVTWQLQREGVDAFAASWRALLESVRSKRAVMV
jgi:transaldolase